MAREVLGGIDLDPASNDYAQTSIKAKTYYSKQEDELKEPWFGRIWCNPPYGSPEVRLLARTFLENAIPSSMVAKGIACYQTQHLYVKLIPHEIYCRRLLWKSLKFQIGRQDRIQQPILKF
jgi:hypothetical protein